MGNIYNEMVVNTQSVVEGLPHSIEGFFYQKNGERDAVREHHANFLRAYHLGSGKEDGRTVPLLMLDFGNLDAPFSLDEEFARG